MSVDEEEYEQIPWSSLLAEQRPTRVRAIAAVLGVVVVVLLVFGWVRWTSSGDGDPIATLTIDSTVASPP